MIRESKEIREFYRRRYRWWQGHDDLLVTVIVLINLGWLVSTWL